MKRSGFKPKTPAAKRERVYPTAIPASQKRQASYTGTTTAEPKTEPLRNPAIMEMAKNRPCLMLIPDVCNGNPETTVAAHSNWSEHGKSGARKADDVYTAWACSACHSHIDQGKAPAAEKKAAWLAAHRRQQDHWQAIAADAAEPAKHRKAAEWALNHLLRVST